MDKNENTFPQSTNTSYTVSNLIYAGLLCTFVAWYVQFLWGRRKLYLYSYKLPGPLGLPLIGSALMLVGKTDKTFDVIDAIFKKYPGLCQLWFGTKLYYVVSDPKYFSIILNSPHALGKDAAYDATKFFLAEGLFSAPVAKWKHHRRLIMPAFNQKILDSFVEVFSDQSECLVKQLEKYTGNGVFDILTIMSRCTLGIIFETAMGIQLDVQNGNDEHTHMIHYLMDTVIRRMYNIFYRSDTIFFKTSVGKEALKMANKLNSIAEKIITMRRAAFEEKLMAKVECEDEPKWKAFLDLLIELTYQDGNKFTDEELREEVNTFIMAGSDTMATANSFVLLSLALRQDVQEKVYNEVMDVLGPHRAVEPTDLPNLKYLEMVIKESLRIFPLASFIARAITADIDLGDCKLAAGSSAVLGILTVHTNEKYWPNPYHFDPDRFLPSEIAKRPPGAYLPFSLGSRNCIGMKYAMVGMKTLLATVIRRYKIYTHYKSFEEVEVNNNVVLKPRHGFKVYIENRDE